MRMSETDLRSGELVRAVKLRVMPTGTLTVSRRAAA